MTQPNPSAAIKPAFIAYHVRDGKDKDSKGFWNRIGAAWRNRDESLTLQLDCFPIDGRVVLQVPKDKNEGEDHTADSTEAHAA